MYFIKNWQIIKNIDFLVLVDVISPPFSFSFVLKYYYIWHS